MGFESHVSFLEIWVERAVQYFQNYSQISPYFLISYLVLCVGYIIIPCISLYCIWFVQESS